MRCVTTLNKDILTELQISQITEFIYISTGKIGEYVDRMNYDRIQKNDSKIPTNREKKFVKTFEKMEGFSFVMPVNQIKEVQMTLNIPGMHLNSKQPYVSSLKRCGA
jgi:hypothetical protein